jgi:hypothetical protein
MCIEIHAYIIQMHTAKIYSSNCIQYVHIMNIHTYILAATASIATASICIINTHQLRDVALLCITYAMRLHIIMT